MRRGWLATGGAPAGTGPPARIGPTGAPGTTVHAQLPAASFFWPQNGQRLGSETTGGGGAFGAHGVPASDGGAGPATSTPTFFIVAANPPDWNQRQKR